MSDFSLADLADLDVTDIQEIRFETLPQGIFDFVVKNPKLDEGTNKDQEKIFIFTCDCNVEEVVAVLDSNSDSDKLVGKTYKQRQNIDPSNPEEGIGRIRAFGSDIGIDSTGKLGDVVARMDETRFRSKIVHQKDRVDPSIIYARLRFDNKK
jgi:hypothetical protein